MAFAAGRNVVEDCMQWPDAFIDAYGTTYATEDRAKIFGTVMSEYMNQGSVRDAHSFL